MLCASIALRKTPVSGAEVRQSVNALYKMYGRGFRKCDMRAVLETLCCYPSPDARIPLVPPTRAVKDHPKQARLAGVQQSP
jgi:hypothetical protein